MVSCRLAWSRPTSHLPTLQRVGLHGSDVFHLFLGKCVPAVELDLLRVFRLFWILSAEVVVFA